MPAARLETISPSEYDLYDSWLSELARSTGASSLSGLLGDSAESMAWKLVMDTKVVAIIMAVVDPLKAGQLYIVVSPDERREGIGNLALEYALGQPEVKNLRSVEASVSADNTAAQKILAKNNFVKIGYDTEGSLLFRLIN